MDTAPASRQPKAELDWSPYETNKGQANQGAIKAIWEAARDWGAEGGGGYRIFFTIVISLWSRRSHVYVY